MSIHIMLRINIIVSHQLQYCWPMFSICPPPFLNCTPEWLQIVNDQTNDSTLFTSYHLARLSLHLPLLQSHLPQCTCQSSCCHWQRISVFSRTRWPGHSLYCFSFSNHWMPLWYLSLDACWIIYGNVVPPLCTPSGLRRSRWLPHSPALTNSSKVGQFPHRVESIQGCQLLPVFYLSLWAHAEKKICSTSIQLRFYRKW